jgi:phosphoribosylamine-glycine ligase
MTLTRKSVALHYAKRPEVRQPSGALLSVTTSGKDLQAAQAAAYAAVETIQFEGAHFRRDIAAKAKER